MIGHPVQFVIPANAGIQWSTVLDTGVRRCDVEARATGARLDGLLKLVTNRD